MTPPEIQPQENEHIFEILPEGTPESIEAFVASLQDDFDYPLSTHLSSIPQDEVTPDDDEQPDDEQPDDEEVPANDSPQSGNDDLPADPPALPDGYVLVKGNPVAISDIERLYEFDQFLRSDQEAAQRVAEAVQPKPAVPTPVAETPSPADSLTPPEFLDLEDPAQKFMWDSYVAQQTQIAAIAQRDQAREQESLDRTLVIEADTAVERFRAAHPNFNDDQILAVRKHAAEMNVVGAVMATSPDRVSGFVRTLDIAALDNPELRTLYLSPAETPPTPTRTQKSATRKRQLNALGGSSGSVPRTSPTSRPMSDRDAVQQFADGLAESFQSN